MFSRGLLSLLLVMAVVSIFERTAQAQLPVCSPPNPSAPVYSICSSTGRFVVAPLLAEFSIEHTIRGEGVVVTRNLQDLFVATADAATQANNASFASYLATIPPLKFEKLDTATGTLRLSVPQVARRYEGDVLVAGVPWEVDIELPEKLEGGYWRTPGSLQLAFWRGAGGDVKVQGPGSEALALGVECLALSSDGLRIVTAGDEVPDVWIRFEACP